MGVKVSGRLWQPRGPGTAFAAEVQVPPSKRAAVGSSRLGKGLGTRDVHVARARLTRVLMELHARIDASTQATTPGADPLMVEAMELRRAVTDVRAGTLDKWVSGPPVFYEDPEFGTVQEEASETAMGLLSDSIVTRAEVIETVEGRDRAQTFADIAFGRSTPIAHYVDGWLAEPGKTGVTRAPRTLVAFRSIVVTFEAWAGANAVGTVEAVTRRVAGRYVAKLHADALSNKRIATVLSALKTYWGWMERRGIVTDDANPWDRQAPPRTTRGPRDSERPFTDTEVVALLNHAPDPVTRDLMHLAALTGARVEELCSLTVGMCADGIFDLPGTKTAAAARRVPIHSALAAMVAERCRDKAPGDYLLPELGEANKFGERSAAIGKRFGRYRQTVGVHDKSEGKRRSKVNFHSWRRWFNTAAIHAGQSERVVSQVLGHALHGMTLGVYFGGDTVETLRACVEAVKLPEAALIAAPEQPVTSPVAPPPKARRGMQRRH